MSTADNGVDFVSAPVDYADLFRRYYSYVVALVRRAGIDDNRAEDVASDILLRFLERGFLDKFDPTLVFHYDGQERPARFKSFLSKFVLAYCRGHWDKQQRDKYREPLVCDSPLFETTQSMMGAGQIVRWIEAHGEHAPGADVVVAEMFGEADLINELRTYLANVPRRSKFDTCDLVALFDTVVDQVRNDGAWNAAEIRAKFGISTTAVHSWMWWMRTNIAACLGRPVPAKRPRTLKTSTAT